MCYGLLNRGLAYIYSNLAPSDAKRKLPRQIQPPSTNTNNTTRNHYTNGPGRSAAATETRAVASSSTTPSTSTSQQETTPAESNGHSYGLVLFYLNTEYGNRHLGGVELDLLLFHRVTGRHVSLNGLRTMATRSEQEYTQGYVFTERPVKLDEKVLIQVCGEYFYILLSAFYKEKPIFLLTMRKSHDNTGMGMGQESFRQSW